MKILKYFAVILTAATLAYCSPKVGTRTSDSGVKTQMPSGNDFRSNAPTAGKARKVELGSADEFTLNNGLKVIVVENHKIPRISYRLYIDRDHIVEGDKAGVLQMTGDILSRGTATKSKAEIDEAVDFVGGSLNTSSRGGFASSLTKHSDTVLELFAEVVLNPSFPPDEFEKIRTQAISGLQAQKDDPNSIAANVSNALNFGLAHPYGEMTTEITLANVNVDDCKTYYDKYFKPNSAYMIVVGDISPSDAKKKVEANFGQWKKGTLPNHEYSAPASPTTRQVDFVDKAGAVQSVINVTYPVNLKPGDQDVIAGRVMNTILGSGFSGRLFRNLREDKGYTYGAYSSLDSDELIGEFSAGASVRNEVTDSAITEFLHELNAMRTEKVTDNELELAKNFIAGSFARNLESPQTVANFALNTARYNLPADYYATYLEKLASVNVDDVLRLAKKYIHPEKARIIVVGNQDEVSDKLAKFDSENGKVAFYDIYAKPKAAPKAMNEEVAGFDVIKKYLDAIGGEAALKKIKTYRNESSMEMMGQSMSVIVQKAAPNKLNMEISMPGMVVMRQVYNGEKGFMEQMGQKQMLEGELLEEMKLQAAMVPEMRYLDDDYTLEVTGIEEVAGEPAYKMTVDGPSGKGIEFYSVATGYKLKSIETQEADGQSTTVTSEMSDYKEVSGIKLPHTVKISGMGPMPFEMKVSKIEINGMLDLAAFIVE